MQLPSVIFHSHMYLLDSLYHIALYHHYTIVLATIYLNYKLNWLVVIKHAYFIPHSFIYNFWNSKIFHEFSSSEKQTAIFRFSTLQQIHVNESGSIQKKETAF